METAVKNTRIQFPLSDGLTKSQVATMATQAVDSVLDKGNIFPVTEALSAMEQFIKAVKADPRFTDYVREELAKHGGKLTTPSGAKIEMKETGTSYDYSHNPQWVELNSEVEAITEKRKELEERLKKIPAGKLLVDEETGESLVGPSKTSKSSYSVTLAK